MDKDEMLDIYNALYTHLADNMHGMLNQLSSDEKPPSDPQPPGAEKLAALEELAAECEVLGDLKRADKLHQDRCAQCGHCRKPCHSGSLRTQ